MTDLFFLLLAYTKYPLVFVVVIRSLAHHQTHFFRAETNPMTEREKCCSHISHFVLFGREEMKNSEG